MTWSWVLAKFLNSRSQPSYLSCGLLQVGLSRSVLSFFTQILVLGWAFLTPLQLLGLVPPGSVTCSPRVSVFLSWTSVTVSFCVLLCRFSVEVAGHVFEWHMHKSVSWRATGHPSLLDAVVLWLVLVRIWFLFCTSHVEGLYCFYSSFFLSFLLFPFFFLIFFLLSVFHSMYLPFSGHCGVVLRFRILSDPMVF